MTGRRACERCTGTDAAMLCALGQCYAEEVDQQAERTAHGLAEQQRWEEAFSQDQRLMVDP